MCNFSREDEVLNYLQRAKKEVMLFLKKFMFSNIKKNQSKPKYS